MRRVKKFFAPILKAFLFILTAIGGAKILYSKVIFPGSEFTPFEIYNPILNITDKKLLFRIIFLVWSVLVYFFLQFILRKKKWKKLIIVSEKDKTKNFLSGAVVGLIVMGVILFALLVLKIYWISEFFFFSKEGFLLMIKQFTAVIATVFLLELIFRATALEQLKEHINKHVANLIISVFFATIYISFQGNDYYPIKQLTLSLFIGYLYYKYGFYLAYGFHFGFNYLESIFFSSILFKIAQKIGYTYLSNENLISAAFLTLGILFFLLPALKKRKNLD